MSRLSFCKEVVKKGCPGVSYVQVSCWAWGKTYSGLHHHLSLTVTTP